MLKFNLSFTPTKEDQVLLSYVEWEQNFHSHLERFVQVKWYLSSLIQDRDLLIMD